MRVFFIFIWLVACVAPAGSLRASCGSTDPDELGSLVNLSRLLHDALGPPSLERTQGQAGIEIPHSIWSLYEGKTWHTLSGRQFRFGDKTETESLNQHVLTDSKHYFGDHRALIDNLIAKAERDGLESLTVVELVYLEADETEGFVSKKIRFSITDALSAEAFSPKQFQTNLDEVLSRLSSSEILSLESLTIVEMFGPDDAFRPLVSHDLDLLRELKIKMKLAFGNLVKPETFAAHQFRFLQPSEGQDPIVFHWAELASTAP